MDHISLQLTNSTQLITAAWTVFTTNGYNGTYAYALPDLCEDWDRFNALSTVYQPRTRAHLGYEIFV